MSGTRRVDIKVIVQRLKMKHILTVLYVAETAASLYYTINWTEGKYQSY